MKKAISIILTVVLGVTGYFGTAYLAVGLNPIDIFTGRGYFVTGEYVRDDNNAVLYIDLSSGSSEFRFELYVKPTDSEYTFETEGVAEIKGRDAYYEIFGESIEFYAERKGVIKITADIGEWYASPDGTYRLADVGIGATVVGSAWPRNPGSSWNPGGSGGSGGSWRPGDGDGPDGPGGGNVQPTPSSPTPGQQRPPVDPGMHLCSPEGAFKVMILMLQDEDFGSRGITSEYSTAEFESVFNYYTDGGSVLTTFRAELDEMADGVASEWGTEFGLDRAITEQFVRDLMKAIVDWIKFFEYEIWGVEYLSDDVAIISFGVEQRVEFNFQRFMEYTVMEKVMADYSMLQSMSEQQIANYIFDIVKDYLINPQNYGAVATPQISFQLRAIKLPNSCWVMDNYQDQDIAEILFVFADSGVGWS